MVLICTCAAQNATTERLIVGTWTDNYSGNTWTFVSNGTVTLGNRSGKYTSTQIIFPETSSNYSAVYNISISSDGKIMILSQHGSTNGILLTKN